MMIETHAVQAGLKPLPNIKNIIAVASGKGGVGKSTVAVNLALALSAQGAQVGILDADIYGPSLPTMMGLIGATPESLDQKTMEPLLIHGIQLASMGFLITRDDAMIWRGPMVTQALQQLLNQTNWRALDFLVLDMPPGTGDIALTLAQKIPTTGAVIVTTPQDVALADARRGIAMFQRVGIDVLGVVENMSTHTCSACGHQDSIFGSGGGAALSLEMKIPLLAQLPLLGALQAQMDQGQPPQISAPSSMIAALYRDLAASLVKAVAAKKIDRSGRFPPIVKA